MVYKIVIESHPALRAADGIMFSISLNILLSAVANKFRHPSAGIRF
jgi:hypothetical protein